MTDIATITPAELERRLAELERLLGVEPRALVPPITIGELANVPAPGSQLAAQWAQDVSSRVVQRFPNVATLKAWAAPVGAFAVQTDTGVLWRRIATGWTQQTPWQASVAGIATTAQGNTTLATVNIPPDPGNRMILASCFVRVDRWGPALGTAVRLRLNGVVVAQTDLQPTADIAPIAGLQIPHYVAMSFIEFEASPTTIVLEYGSPNPAAGNWTVPAGPYQNRLNVTVMPRGY